MHFGALQPLAIASDSLIDLTLAPATANTIHGYPDAYFIGGLPAIVVEPLPDTYLPLAPTYDNLPPPGEA